MKELRIVATITSKLESAEVVFAALQSIVKASRQESGCVSYDLHRDTKNRLRFIILECWQSQEAIDEHNATEHFKAFIRQIAGHTESVTVDVIEQIL